MKAKVLALCVGIVAVWFVALLQAQGTFWVVQNGVMTFNGAVKVNGTTTITGTTTVASLSTTGNGIAITGTGSLFLVNTMLFNAVAPTISSGFGSTPSASITSSNGSATFRVNVGGGGVATSGVIGLPTATTGWNCIAVDMTTNVVTRQTASATNTATLTAASAWGAQDILLLQCEAF